MAEVSRAPFSKSGSNPISSTLANKLLERALSHGGNYADLFFEFALSGSYAFEEGVLKTLGRSASLGLGVRVVRGDATGYAYVESVDEPSMMHAAETAARIAEGAPRQPSAIQPVELPSRYPIVVQTWDVEGEEKRALLQRADQAARAFDPRITRVEASLSEEYREIMVISSDGVWASDVQPLMRFGIRTLAEDGTLRQSGSSGGGGRVGLEYFNTYTPEWHAQQAAQQALIMLDAREAPAGELPVVLAPGDSGILLHEAVGHGLEADFNRKRTSNYTSMIGKQVASELCTVVDDATLSGSRGSVNVDDEGNIPQSSMLIERGVLVGYMHDRHSSEFFKTSPSGHGRRESFRSHPMPRMTNTLLLQGQDAPEDIVKSVQRGIYAKRFGGGQVDIANGDFVFSLTEGYLIEDGKITAPVKGVNLIGNGPEIMRRVTRLGHDMLSSDGVWTCGKNGQSVPVGVGCPTILIGSMTVGGTQLG